MFSLDIAGKEYKRPAEVIGDYQADLITARNITEAIQSPALASALISHWENFGGKTGERLYDALMEKLLSLQVDINLSLDGRVDDTFTFPDGAPNPYFVGRAFRIKAFVEMFEDRVTKLLVGTDENFWYYNPSIGQQVVNGAGETVIDEEGPYCSNGESLLNRAYNLVSGDRFHDGHLRQIKTYVRTKVSDRDKFDPTKQDPNFLPFLNGVLEIRTLKLHNHDPRFRYPSAIPHNWNPDATCPILHDALGKIFKGDDELARLYFYIAGQVLYRGKPLQSISWWFYGNGRNGKSILGEHLRYMVGDHNTCNIAPQKLDERFMSSRLEGKSLNLCTDAPMQHFGDTSVFKQAISGETLEVERKNENIHPILPFATHVIGTNQRPNSPRDITLGFRRRTCVIPFEQMFVPNPGPHQEREDVTMAQKLRAEVEGAIVEAAKSLRLMLLEMDRNDGRIEWAEPAACQREMKEVLKASNPAIAYLAEVFSEEGSFGPSSDPKYRQITAKALYEDYKNWFISTGCRGKPVPKSDFLDEIRTNAGEKSQRVVIERDSVLDQIIVAGVYSEDLINAESDKIKNTAEKFGQTEEEAAQRLAVGQEVEEAFQAAIERDEDDHPKVDRNKQDDNNEDSSDFDATSDDAWDGVLKGMGSGRDGER